ncbi:hypothetical protein ElyMa_005660700 [Elysia marginata]|uniref:Uncharacterized protein n=1 Tax=Elysia marginata TaxID=1093978 RepID=A0AAV4FDJ7_9GAST|nr:hypothetical protein ElyMa_005660700 [Elysia marginata]
MFAKDHIPGQYYIPRSGTDFVSSRKENGGMNSSKSSPAEDLHSDLSTGVFDPEFDEGAEGSQGKWVKTFVEEEEGWWGKSYVQKLRQLGVDPDIKCLGKL